MGEAPLVIDVATALPDGAATIVVVEPLYAVPAIAAALEAGWGSVEVADARHDATPIPLVSFEQPPSAAHRGGRCRVRASDVAQVARGAAAAESTALLGAPAFARPLAAQLAARLDAERIVFLVAPCGDEALTSDALWAAGMLVRVLLEELDDRPSRLTDAAGIAVTIAQGAEDAAAQLSSGVRWRRHLERGGHPDDLRVASAIDTIGVVPELVLEGDALIARPWHPQAV